MINIGKPTGAVGWCGYGSGHLGRFADSENHPEIGWSPSNSCHFVEEMPRVSMAINDQESGTKQWDSLPMEDLSLINDVANHTDLSFFFLPTQCSKTFFWIQLLRPPQSLQESLAWYIMKRETELKKLEDGWQGNGGAPKMHSKTQLHSYQKIGYLIHWTIPIFLFNSSFWGIPHFLDKPTCLRGSEISENGQIREDGQRNPAASGIRWKPAWAQQLALARNMPSQHLAMAQSAHS